MCIIIKRDIRFHLSLLEMWTRTWECRNLFTLLTVLMGKQTRQGRSVVLIWGYQGQHIIAQIDGSSLEEVKSQGIVPDLIASREEPTEEDWRLLNQLRSRLPNAQVVTTRYEPLVGIVSQTDARGVTYRYTYDEFNRLCEVIETGEQEHVLRKTEYKYATEY